MLRGFSWPRGLALTCISRPAGGGWRTPHPVFSQTARTPAHSAAGREGTGRAGRAAVKPSPRQSRVLSFLVHSAVPLLDRDGSPLLELVVWLVSFPRFGSGV